MQIEFHKQRTEGAITTLDEVELYNCEDPGMNGNYTVADVDPESGDVTLVGKGGKSGYITTICIA